MRKHRYCVLNQTNNKRAHLLVGQCTEISAQNNAKYWQFSVKHNPTGLICINAKFAHKDMIKPLRCLVCEQPYPTVSILLTFSQKSLINT